jgi:flap endonuclease-1
VRVTPKHNDEAKKLLQLMGIPYIEAPSEAEAQCAAMTRAGLVYATGSEDMDSLTFGASIIVRHLTFSEARKMPIKEINLAKVLSELNFTMDQVRSTLLFPLI